MRKHLFLTVVIFFGTTVVGTSNFLKDPLISKMWQDWANKEASAFLNDKNGGKDFPKFVKNGLKNIVGMVVLARNGDIIKEVNAFVVMYGLKKCGVPKVYLYGYKCMNNGVMISMTYGPEKSIKNIAKCIVIDGIYELMEYKLDFDCPDWIKNNRVCYFLCSVLCPFVTKQAMHYGLDMLINSVKKAKS